MGEEMRESNRLLQEMTIKFEQSSLKARQAADEQRTATLLAERLQTQLNMMSTNVTKLQVCYNVSKYLQCRSASHNILSSLKKKKSSNSELNSNLESLTQRCNTLQQEVQDLQRQRATLTQNLEETIKQVGNCFSPLFCI
jgi:chromosome segregation ATPase